MTKFNPLNFVANHAGMNLADAIKEAYEQGKRDAQPEQAVKDCRNCKHGKYNDYHDTYFCYNEEGCSNWDKWETSEQPDGISLEWIDKHLEWLDNCDNDFAQLAKVGIRAMVEIWKRDKI